ncbi:hypothetical protein AB0O87_10605 [Microbacterium sp. NPDC076768]|uniref:hypothetical protein n=1 Tax=Microbacterium sp. NPDC076768 TaxID=3154858 RepID=UPI0034396F22
MHEEPTTKLREKSPAAGWRIARLIIAAALLVAYALAALSFYKECSTKNTEGAALVTTCQPPTVTSATVLVLLLLVVLLLWPDISEVTVLGVSLTRKVAAAEADAKKARDDVTSLQTSFQLQQVRIDGIVEATASASANITMHNNWGAEPQWSKDRSAQLEDIANKLSSQNTPGEAEAPSSNQSASTSDLKLELLSQYEAFATKMGYNYDRRRLRASEDPAVKRWAHAQREFFEENRDAVQSVRALRNGIAHAQPVERQDVVEGLQVLSRLRPMLEKHYASFDVRVPYEVEHDSFF